MGNENALQSNAERKAKQAEGLRAFGNLNLSHIKSQVGAMLSLIGREGIFDQYTNHDISHIDKMLESLDWIISDQSKENMSVCDYLMTVLSIYFHDLGMLVTKKEFEERSKSDFPRYRDEVLFGGPQGADYRAKVQSLPSEAVERFLYQEFVRHKHAERVRSWVTGAFDPEMGEASLVAREIDKLLEPLGEQFRRDLGLVCESHHLDDLGDLKKYKPAQPYGDSDAETANLQFCAVLLRTADLLHITLDRTPSISFRLINPTDPVSQQEWAKQNAVRRVRPKTAVNDEGTSDERLPKDTIVVHAYFTKPDGFFGLTSYLSYIETQLKKSNEWIAASKKLGVTKHEFNWRRIEDDIETKGFLRDTFEFSIDQAKILDLLTGHTLYNDTQVVLREVCQNAIDAIRLQCHPAPPKAAGKIKISWNSQERILSVTDNGTGMTQAIISNFLLRVGTSRYQDADFKKKYPNFSSISRFGIGVLSTFMIADSVEIVTCHPEDSEARHLILKSVHGKYLIELVPKTDPVVSEVVPHGTKFSLKVRHSISMPDVLETAKLWLVVPGCEVTVQIDNGAPVNVGHDSLADALVSQLALDGIAAEIATDTQPPAIRRGVSAIRVVEKSRDGVSLAYAISWNPYFKEWTLLQGPHRELHRPLLGTSIEGVRVEFYSPGFTANTVYALANVQGANAPKTNVARSGLEATAERDKMLRTIYGFYREHVETEIEELTKRRSFSLTWATAEARFILQAILAHDQRERVAISQKLLVQELHQLPALLVEKGGIRSATSVAHVAELPSFWTIDCALFHSAEPLIREAATSTSLEKVINSLGLPDFGFPTEEVICGVPRGDPYFGEGVFKNREVSEVRIYPDKRRVDLHWVFTSDPPRWHALSKQAVEAARAYYSDQDRHYGPDRSFEFQRLVNLRVASERIAVHGNSEEIGVGAFGQTFLLPNTRISQFAAPLLQECARLGSEASGEKLRQCVFVCQIILNCIGGRKVSDAEKVVNRLISFWQEAVGATELRQFADENGIVELIRSTEWNVFSPSAWSRDSRGGSLFALAD